ncbi:hypothetical protein Tdes44962_MAKER08323 [Teratosphaeria destructans]|uniref:Uncharacterized protein n=1 Tax=Teratosphaeria destructans TaxID=418781 RepID=A0A9W7SXC5_9PEZI|nr:hypothetical protein Tdes44962_MAKER08323 [Teratosphaeria destructans]
MTNDKTHATSAARSLEHDRETDALAFLYSILFGLDQTFGARDDGHSSFLRESTSHVLYAEGYNGSV